LLVAVLLASCEVPTPPPELPTATPGSQNPENAASRFGLTPVRITPAPGFTPLAVPPGHIYFVRDSGLWVINPDGSGEKQLSKLPMSSPPQPSPDGTMIAWVSGQDLYVMPTAGGTPRKLVSGNMAEHQRLGWSPDGSLLGYVTDDPAAVGTQQAWSVTVAGGQPSPVTSITFGVGRGPTYDPSMQWSPDGKWVLVSGINNPMRLLRWPLSNDRSDDVRDIPGGEPDWAPDSRTIVYAQTLSGALSIYYVIEAGATPFRDEQQFVGTGSGEYAQGPAPRWSPASSGSDTDPIAYRSRAPEGEPRVSVRRRGGREIGPLPNNTNNPSWSPSGDQLVVETGYVKLDPLGPIWVPTGLSIAVIDLGGNHTIAPLVKDGKWPAWGR
jgi:Tol biopolymer transport system component